jgi:hypothetical protein
MPAPPRAAAGDPPSSLLCDAEMVSFINAARTRGAKTRYISLMRFATAKVPQREPGLRHDP